MIGWLFLAVASGLFVVLIVRASLSSARGNPPSVLEGSPANSPADDSATSQPGAPKPQAPPFSGLTLHPYDLLKNPYQAKGKLIALNLNTMPILYDGAVMRYSDPIDPTFGVRLGLMALRLERFAQEDTALYDVMGMEAGGSTGQMLGQVAVELPEGKTELRFDRAWMVEPLDPLQGTNYSGAPIQIPSVRFWRYVGENDESATSEDAKIAPSMGSGQSSLAQTHEATDDLADALAEYAATLKREFEIGTAGGSLSREIVTEGAREQERISSILGPRINAAIDRKYRRRPNLADYPGVFNILPERIYSVPSCRRCLDLDIEIQAPLEVINRYLPLPPNQFRVGLSCRVRISIARNKNDDEAFIENIDRNDCFEARTEP